MNGVAQDGRPKKERTEQGGCPIFGQMRLSLAVFALVLSCDASSPVTENRPMEAAADTNTRPNAKIDAQIVLGATLVLLENANLRDGPSGTDLVLRIVPSGSKVVVTASTSPRWNEA